MKKSIFIAMLFISCYTNAQIKDDDKTRYPVVGAAMGYMSGKVTITIPELGYKFDGFYVSFRNIVRTGSDKSIPFIEAFSLGYGNGLQPFISGSYVTTGTEAHYSLKEQGIETHNGWKFGYGLNYYLPFSTKLPVRISVERQGGYTIVGGAIYTAL